MDGVIVIFLCLVIQCMQEALCQVANEVRHEYVDTPEYKEYKDPLPPLLDYDYIVKTPGPPPLECYTCHYSRSQGHDQGMRNCDEPFRADGIPSIACYGSCAVTNHTSKGGAGGEGGEDYLIVRSCLANCKDIADPTSSVRCCDSHKCNGRTERPKDTVIVLGTGSVVITMAVLFVLWCYRKT